MRVPEIMPIGLWPLATHPAAALAGRCYIMQFQNIKICYVAIKLYYEKVPRPRHFSSTSQAIIIWATSSMNEVLVARFCSKN
jgi:hypothetical protein